MQILKKTYSKNNNEITLFEKLLGIDTVGQVCPTYNKTILIIGVFHGDEPQGKFLIEDYLNKANEQRTVNAKTLNPLTPTLSHGGRGRNRMLFIPCLNPDGLNNDTRQNANGVDLNRNFPTKNWKKTEKNEFFGGEKAASEIETKFVVEVIEEFSPDIILTIHAPFKVVNYDGPAETIARKISEIINYPVQHDIGYPTPGSFGTYAGVERNIPTITLELDEDIDIAELTTPMNKIFKYLALH